MDSTLALTVHLIVAACGAWLLVLAIRKILDAINAGMNGTFYLKGWVQVAGRVLDKLMPILPCAPAGGVFLVTTEIWPADAILFHWLARFIVGCVAGSVASNVYNAVRRQIRKSAESGLPGAGS